MGALAEDTKKPIDPEPVSTVYYVDPSARKVPLESQTVHMKNKFHALGFAGGTTVFLADGEKSPVRIKSAEAPNFVVRLQAGTDPLETVQFYRFDSVNGSRVAPIWKFDALGRPSSALLNSAAVDFNSTKYGTSSARLIPVRALVPGEYCLFIKPTNKWPKKSPGFCFGVDPAGN